MTRRSPRALEQRPRGRREPRTSWSRDDRARPRRRHRRRMGRRAARGVRRVPRAHRRVRRRGLGRRRHARGARTGEGGRPSGSGGPLRMLVGKPGPRRPLQRRRADRGRGARRRHGGRVPGHPAHARPRSRPRPATRTSTSSGLSILSGSHLELVPETLRQLRAAGVDGPGGRGWHHSRPRTPGPRGMPASPGSTRPRTTGWPDHGRHGRSGGRIPGTAAKSPPVTVRRGADALRVKDRYLACSIAAGFAALTLRCRRRGTRIDELGVVAGAFGFAAAILATAIGARRPTVENVALTGLSDERDRLRRELDALGAIFADEAAAGE